MTRSPAKVSNVVKQHKHTGWRESYYFPGEYTLLLNARLDKVRVYDTGVIWQADPKTGEYRKLGGLALREEQLKGKSDE